MTSPIPLAEVDNPDGSILSVNGIVAPIGSFSYVATGNGGLTFYDANGNIIGTVGLTAAGQVPLPTPSTAPTSPLSSWSNFTAWASANAPLIGLSLTALVFIGGVLGGGSSGKKKR
jgi:hypothetical protein